MQQIENRSIGIQGNNTNEDADKGLEEAKKKKANLMHQIFSLSALTRTLYTVEGAHTALELENAKEEEHHSAQEVAQKEVDGVKEVLQHLSQHCN